jgi:hypothetical protein
LRSKWLIERERERRKRGQRRAEREREREREKERKRLEDDVQRLEFGVHGPEDLQRVVLHAPAPTITPTGQ